MKQSKSSGYESIANLLIENCARVNEKTKKEERTPLHLAAMNGNLPIQFILNKWHFNKILNKSTLSGHSTIFIKLINSGANMKLQDINSKTANELALSNGNSQMKIIFKQLNLWDQVNSFVILIWTVPQCASVPWFIFELMIHKNYF